MSEIAVLIVAAGRGARAGGGEIPKQYREIGGDPVLALTLDRFLSYPLEMRIAVAIAPEDAGLYRSCAPQDKRLLPPVSGGRDRQASVLNGLRALASTSPEKVLIHDGVRPFVSAGLIERVIEGLSTAEAVLPASPVAATLKRVDERGFVSATVDRDGLRTAETPQGFHFGAILKAHTAAAERGLTFTDDAAVAEWAGMQVKVVAGEAGNIKLTTAEEIADADRRIAGERALALGEVRVGTGYDVHAFGPGDQITLGGIVIPHDRGVVAHSDGDVALHALTDALFGALAEGDIGDHFPPSDPRWRGAASEVFLRHAVGRVTARGGMITHLDVTIVTEVPRIARRRKAMQARIAAICAIGTDRVAVKATTSEGLGFIGRREGLAASAAATIRLPFRRVP